MVSAPHHALPMPGDASGSRPGDGDHSVMAVIRLKWPCRVRYCNARNGSEADLNRFIVRATMAGFFNTLARMFGRRISPRSEDRHGSVNILIREGTKILSGQELYREVATANEAEAAAELKAFHERIDRKMPGGPG